MSQAIRKAANVVQTSYGLYKELLVSATQLVPRRR